METGMAKFLTRVALNADPNVECNFEAESAREVCAILSTLLAPMTAGEAVLSESTLAAVAETATAAVKRGRGRPRKPKSGVVGVISPAGAAIVSEGPPVGAVGVHSPSEPVTQPANLPSLAEISDAIRAYARQPGVGVPGVTALMHEFKTDAGEPAQQVKAIAQSEYPRLLARLKTLIVVS